MRNGYCSSPLAAWLAVGTLVALAISVSADDSPRGRSAVKELIGDINSRIAETLPHLEFLYKDFHAHPELSLQEVHTAARLAREMKENGIEVTERVGKTGIVAVLRNGQGPTVLVRTDMDALPVVEHTGLPYASKVRARDRYGNDVGVMHACGHDMHMTVWTGTARVL